MSFTMFNFHARIVAGVQALGYVEPTPIQLQAIPPVLQGRDVMGLAQTGTGKTAAFALPILQRLIQRPSRRVRALIVAPTRELAEQIHDTIRALGQQTNARSVTASAAASGMRQTASPAERARSKSGSLSAARKSTMRRSGLCRRSCGVPETARPSTRKTIRSAMRSDDAR